MSRSLLRSIKRPLKRQIPLAIYLVFRVLKPFSLRTVQRVGVALGWLMYHLPNGGRDIARRNIELCFPELPPTERDALLRQSLRQTGKTIMELGPMWLWPIERVRPLNRGVEGFEHFEKLRDAGNGVIALTPHLGNWEIMGLLVPEMAPMTSLYRTGKLGVWEERIKRARERNGNRLQPTTVDGIRAVYAALKGNELVGILPDQDPGKGWGMFVPFFGIPAYTMNFVARLAIRSKVGVVIAYAERLPDGSGFRGVVRPVDAAINEGPVEHSVAVMNKAIEDLVRNSPDQYLWIYPRFRRRPEGEGPIYS
ncbi:MAG: lysophospholipid acyltransferase family protein [Gammaproteobacteria bacterium]